MLITLPRCTATWSQCPRLVYCRFCLLVGFAIALTGCQSRPVAVAMPVRSLSGSTEVIAQTKSSPLYQQAREACKHQDFDHAAALLQTLARTPGLAPEAVTFVQQQRNLCLKEAGKPVAAPVIASQTARAPSDADCGPRALLLVCQPLGVHTTLETLRRAAGTTATGTTLAGLQQAAQKLGLKAEGVQVSREALPDTVLPAIAWFHRDHYVALLAVSGSGDTATATIHDPNKPAEETLSQEQLLQRSGGYLLLVHR